MIMVYACRLGVLLSLIFGTFASIDGTIIPQSPKLALRLIHRDSIFSPSYNSKLSFSSSVGPRGSTSLSLGDVRAPLVPMEDRSIFLVNISIGEPPVPHLLAMDTGSTLIWVHCTGSCDECYNVFDPKMSSTYRILSSASPQCYYSAQPRTIRGLQCSYGIRYEDQSSSSGVLSMDKFTFVTSTGGTVEVPDVVFGCASESHGAVRNLNGILGLEAPHMYTFASRAGNKFSYCIGNISDTGYMYNQLILGDGAVLEGDSTPMRIKNGHYFVTLEGISVGDKQVIINQEEFYYGVAIDSGTTWTNLVKSAYEPLVAEVKRLMNGMLQPVETENENQVCYQGNLERDLKGFPIVTLHLAEGADIYLDVEGMFQRSPDGSAFCLAVAESGENLIGVNAQQYYNVGFDLNAKRVTFQRIDCELLED